MKFSAQAFLGFFFTLFVSLFLVVVPTHAQTQPNSAPDQAANPYLSPNTNPNVDKNLHYLTQSMVYDMLSSSTCILGGIDAVNPKQPCLGPDAKTGKLGYVNERNGGIIGSLSTMIGYLYTPPVQVNDYVQYVAHNFNSGVGKAEAANSYTDTSTPGSQNYDYGFSGLFPFLQIWAVFRNMVYLIFIIIFVIIGLAIMLRLKIDPRTVMTIQNQIPKLVIGIILVTFSYAISAFMVDLMWTSTYLVINIFSEAEPNINSTAMTNDLHEPPISFVNDTFTSNNSILAPIGGTNQGFHTGGILGITIQAAGYAGQGFFSLISPALHNLLFDTNGYGITSSVTQSSGCGSIPIIGGVCDAVSAVTGFVGNAIAGLAGTVLSTVFSIIFGSIVFLIVLLAIVIALFRIWFALLKCYIYILMQVVLAPWYILWGMIPGKNGFGIWFKNMVSNLIAFPATLVMFLLGNTFMLAAQSGNPFQPPFIGAQGNTNALGAIIGIGFILSTPGIVELMKHTFGSQGLPSSALGATLGAANPMGWGGGMQGMYYKGMMLNQFGLLGRIPGIGPALEKRYSQNGGGQLAHKDPNA